MSIIFTSTTYNLIFIASFLGWVVFELWVFWRDRKNGLTDHDNRRWVIILLTIGILLAFNLPEAVPIFNFTNYISLLFFLGIVLVWAGLLFRYWAIKTLGKFFSTKLIIQEEHKLITSGPYKYIRHPSYTAVLITFLGFGLSLCNYLSLVVLVITVLIAYIRRIKIEEKILQNQFGKLYEDYKQKSWALIPFVW